MNELRGLWRGKRVVNGEWALGCLIRSSSKAMIFVLDGKTNRISGTDVDPSTIGECTGLRDKNGKLIFEGDIVLAYYNPKEKTAIGVIRYGKFMDTDSLDDYGYLGWYIEVQGHCISILQPDTDGICIEVIGNIHDNPELLKGEANGQD